MAKANHEAAPKGITLLDGKATTNGNPFSNAKPTVNGSSEPNEEMTNGGSPLGEISSLTVKSNVVRYPTTVRKYRNDLGVVCGQSFHHTDSLEEFLDFIARDRLRHMPQKVFLALIVIFIYGCLLVSDIDRTHLRAYC